MPKLPAVSGKQAARAFERAGWVLARQAGSQMIYTKQGQDLVLSIPNHKQLDKGLLRRLVRDAGMTIEEFIGFHEQ